MYSQSQHVCRVWQARRRWFTFWCHQTRAQSTLVYHHCCFEFWFNNPLLLGWLVNRIPNEEWTIRTSVASKLATSKRHLEQMTVKKVKPQHKPKVGLDVPMGKERWVALHFNFCQTHNITITLLKKLTKDSEMKLQYMRLFSRVKWMDNWIALRFISVVGWGIKHNKNCIQGLYTTTNTTSCEWLWL